MVWLIRKAREFRADEDGIALILVSIMLPVIIGFALLAIDMSRVNNLHYDLQRGADAMALATAAELDGKADAITRADRALATLVANRYRFSSSGGTQQPSQVLAAAGVTRRFLTGLPANDATAIDNSYQTTDPALAQFVEVRVTPVDFGAIFPATFLGGANSFAVGATAVAGFFSGVCDFTPLYICNPYEGTGVTLDQVVTNPALRGRMIELRQQGGTTAQNSPGNYGFLVPSTGNSGANNIRDMIAATKPATCFGARGVEVRPGFLATARDAINVRLDVYNGAMNGAKNDPQYAPANNVRKGYRTQGGGCNSTEMTEPNTGYERMSRDLCFYNGTCDARTGLNTGNRLGDGVWDFEKYWTENRYDLAGVAKPLGRNGTSTASNTNPPTRYSLYRYEIAHPALITQSSVAGEIGSKQCSNQTAPATLDRRLIYGAIINCKTNPIGSGASGDPVPVEAFASFFLTETVESGPDQIIRVELVDVTGGGAGSLNSFVRDEVQLYR